MSDYSDRQLDETPERATRFLTGLAADPVIRTLMLERAGMADEDIEEGAELLKATFTLPPTAKPATDSEAARQRRGAAAELNAWDEPNFARAQATLARHHPEQGEYVFRDLAASEGVQAVKGVGTFLSRIDALEQGSDPDRKASKKDDHKAVELLARRGFSAAERQRLAALVALALSPADALTSKPDDGSARRQQLTALRRWYDEWATAAHSVLKKRSHLIRLGLASRRSPGSADTE